VNVVLVLIDSLNRHSLSAYGESGVATPNIDRVARRSWRFDNHFVGSLPCMPARRELLAGRRELLWRAWGPLEPYDRRLPDLLRAAGLVSAIVTDHYHYWEEAGNGYLQGFDSSTLIRGHEVDRWREPLAADEPLPRWVRNMARWRPESARRYYANVRGFEGEEDFFPARVFRAAADWLDLHQRGQPFYLQVESFDVHEPFHVPEPYASMYGPSPDEVDFTIWPPYQRTDELAAFMDAASEAELEFIRAQYAGKLTMTDRWFGELLDAFDRHALWDDTALIVTTDHGHDLGEHGAFGKQFPHHDSHANIPLFLWHPGVPAEGRSVTALTTTVDLFSTVLELAGAEPPRSRGLSLLPLLAGDGARRDALLYGSFGTGACATDGEWTIMRAPVADGPLYSYSTQLFESLLTSGVHAPVAQGHFIPDVPYPQWRLPFALTQSQPAALENVLIHRADGAVNRWDTEPDERRRMLELLRDLVASEGAPPEQYERLGLPR
jgi:arylsulfatase A-like enzyme